MSQKKKTRTEQLSKPPPPPPTTFSSLPNDILLNCLARVSKLYRPTVSVVSKDLRSLMVSPELKATRTCMGTTENNLCVCLDLGYNKGTCSWFKLAPSPKQEVLKPITWCHFLYPISCSVLSVGSELYLIGGYVVDGKTRKYQKAPLVLDCRYPNQLRRLPTMRVRRVTPAVDVINGKIYVVGGSVSKRTADWGEVYDPMTQTWEAVSPFAQELSIPMRMVHGRMVMGGKVYCMEDVYKLSLVTDVCLVEIDNMLYQAQICKGKLVLRWSRVKGLEALPELTHLTSLANSEGERRRTRVAVWWKKEVVACVRSRSCSKECNTEIWCAEISFERRGADPGELWGFVGWSKIVLTLDRCGTPSSFLLDSAIVTY
ncbi:putative F-box/kelch-repeat protein At5g03000 [Capsella rubella]|nr:putative F-box/kelch-repeat protein At5g03000 [Capsella rubella]